MGDIKQIRRLATAGNVVYNDDGLHTVQLTDHKEGGSYDLHPLVKSDGSTVQLLLPHPTAPGYGVVLEADTETADRLGRALVGAARKGKGAGEEEEG